MSIVGVDEFREKVWDFYRDHGRHDLPWRVDPSPYHVFVSEIMLQQTQVSRVLVKYGQWLEAFADFEVVAGASVSEVLAVWQGLGYNRRGLWVRDAAIAVMNEYGGQLPRNPAELVKLKGVGKNTAGSMAAFAYDEPVVFIETNIRRVFIHEFFGEDLGGSVSGPVADGTPLSSPSSRGLRAAGSPPLASPESVADKALLPLIEAAMDREHPREWYWALMDYGADLAKRVPNPNRRSKHYAVQSTFEGSARQIRGEVLRQLLSGPKAASALGVSDQRLPEVLAGLQKDGLIRETPSGWALEA